MRLELVERIKQSVRVPVAVKLSLFFSAPANFGKHLCEAGADGLVLFNRFYQPDFDIEDREIVPSRSAGSGKGGPGKTMAPANILPRPAITKRGG
jgi:dihydroorotate dehydrogenase